MTPAEEKLPQRFHSIPAQGIYNAKLFDSEHFSLTGVRTSPKMRIVRERSFLVGESLRFRPSGSGRFPTGRVSHKAINRTFEA